MRVTVSPEVAAELTSIRLYLEQFNPKIAREIAGKLISAIYSLDAFPNRGRLRPDGLRELLSVRPYVIVYRVGQDRVTIARIWHGAQNRT